MDQQGDSGTAIDPVCGMTVETDDARERGLVSAHDGEDYFFCSRGCKLEFDDEPPKYLDQDYVPSM
jgi:Cu+-exporting ATPase